MVAFFIPYLINVMDRKKFLTSDFPSGVKNKRPGLPLKPWFIFISALKLIVQLIKVILPLIHES
jgi:hypothetical protein